MDFRKTFVAAAALTMALGPAYAVADYNGDEAQDDTQIESQAANGNGATGPDEADPGAQEGQDEPGMEDDTLAEDPADDPDLAEDPAEDPGIEQDQQAAAPGEEFLTRAEPGTLRVGDLMDQNVVGSGGEDLGTVDDVLLSEDGQVEGIVISSGGFLGIGDKRVAVPWDQVEVQPQQEELQTQFTEQQIADAPEFEDDAMAEDPGMEDEPGAQDEPGIEEEPMEQDGVQ